MKSVLLGLTMLTVSLSALAARVEVDIAFKNKTYHKRGTYSIKPGKKVIISPSVEMELLSVDEDVAVLEFTLPADVTESKPVIGAKFGQKAYTRTASQRQGEMLHIQVLAQRS